MREILQELNREAGVVGSMIITPDGIMVAAAMGQDFEEEPVAAFASSMLLTLKRSLSDLKVTGDMTRCTLSALGGRMLFLDMKNSYLVVVTRPEAHLEDCAQAIQAAVEKVMNRKVA
jgi:predicted regulator of Ras-like GTPase activity (Roadblock/LC7/MglB family)